jgi:hypothetical protein
MKWFRNIFRHAPPEPVAVILSPLPAISSAPEWTALDRDTLRSILNSETGKKLVARLRATEYAVAVANAKDQFHTQHSAGRTVGYSECINHILTLTISCAAEQAKSAEDGGGSGEARPIEREMDELVQRISP